MLKIKDNVDLKELLKMGFEHTEGTNVYQHNAIVDKEDRMFGVNSVIISFLSTDRILHIYCDKEREFTEIDIIYDLIKADMVEKVEVEKDE